MPTAVVNGIDVFYERSGQGPPLLLLNGSGATVAGSALLLKPFAKAFDLVAHDQRGLGLTSEPDGPYAMADYVADALGLLDHLGWETASVVGISRRLLAERAAPSSARPRRPPARC